MVVGSQNSRSLKQLVTLCPYSPKEEMADRWCPQLALSTQRESPARGWPHLQWAGLLPSGNLVAKIYPPKPQEVPGSVRLTVNTTTVILPLGAVFLLVTMSTQLQHQMYLQGEVLEPSTEI